MSGRWPEPPHWSSAYRLRDRVRSTLTGDKGKVVGIDPDRRLLIEWQSPRSTAPAWTSYGADIEKVEPL